MTENKPDILSVRPKHTNESPAKALLFLLRFAKNGPTMGIDNRIRLALIICHGSPVGSVDFLISHHAIIIVAAKPEFEFDPELEQVAFGPLQP